jgi:outer membrane protein OmpA-like peptidoglycan-associated protein
MLKVIRHSKIIIVCLLVALMTTGCGQKSMFIVMPDPDGKVGKVEVVNQKGSITLDKPWQATEVAGLDQMPGEPKVMDEKQVRELFKEALGAKPESPVKYRIYFISGGTELTTESKRMIPEIVKTINLRTTHEIDVSGHTDSVASADFNRILSLKRAREVAALLVSRGVKKGIIEITFHGKENQLIPTPDGVEEPRNRRVEITIR